MSRLAQLLGRIKDPIEFGRIFWPGVDFYDRQQEVIYSVKTTPETVVVAGNMLGKDFVAGFLSLGAFLVPNVFLRPVDDPLTTQSVRIVTTSVKDDHLRVLWGEIGRFIQTSRIPLLKHQGGPLIFNHRELRKVNSRGEEDEISYLRGMVSKRGEGMAGHHAPHTFALIDEASGVEDIVYTMGVDTWAKRKLIIGNAWECQNFFRRAVREGEVQLE